MSREVRRVPLDFDWPINKIWSGYVMPESLHSLPCIDCDSRGETAARRWVDQIAWMLIGLDDDLRQQALGRPMHPYYDHTGSIAHGVRPSADIAEFCSGLAGEPPSFFGRSTTDCYRLTRKLVALAGLDDETWGWCTSCAGQGSTEAYPGQAADAEKWERSDPPTGEGWQLWETVSDGSPISLVFSDRERLVQWLMSPAYTWGASQPLTRTQAENLTESGWAPSFIYTAATGLVPGEQVAL